MVCSAGWVTDVMNSYDLSFYLAGVFIGISGLVLLVLPLYRRASGRGRAKHNLHQELDPQHADHNGKLLV
jgi:hypothetical protein